MTDSQEVSRVLVEMESDLIRSKETAEEVFSPGHCPPDLTRWEWRVQEISDLRGGNSSPQLRGKEHQMETVNPDEITLLIDFHDLLHEEFMYLVIVKPEGLLCFRVEFITFNNFIILVV